MRAPWFPGTCVDTLRVLGGQLAEDLDFCLDHPVSLGVRVTDGAAGALGGHRSGNVFLCLVDHDLQVLIEIWIGCFDIRRVSDELR